MRGRKFYLSAARLSTDVDLVLILDSFDSNSLFEIVHS